MNSTCVDCQTPIPAGIRCDECQTEVNETPLWRTGAERRMDAIWPASKSRGGRTARCGHRVLSHPGRQRVACDNCARPARPTRTPRSRARSFLPVLVRIDCPGCTKSHLISQSPTQAVARKYCSKRCQSWARSHPGVPTPPLGECQRCGEALTRTGKKFCSKECGEIARGQRLSEPLPRLKCALPECGVEFQPKSKRQRCCCEKHGKLFCHRNRRATGLEKNQPWNDRRRDSYHRRRAQRKNASTGRPVLLAEIAERDGWRCHLCRKQVGRTYRWPHPKSASLDHLIPLSDTANTSHDPVNVRLAHLVCNTKKGNRPANEQLLLVG